LLVPRSILWEGHIPSPPGILRSMEEAWSGLSWRIDECDIVQVDVLMTVMSSNAIRSRYEDEKSTSG
jgi:hypothetical protein